MAFNLLRKVNSKKNAWVRQKKAKNLDEFVGKLEVSKPIVVLGNQKTGSTAIAALLAEATGQSVTLDLQRAIQDVGWQLCVKYGVTNFDEIVYRYKEDFSRTIIKEPSLTYFYKEMVDLIPSAKFVFIQRNPYQNIRSILNRLKIPGNLAHIRYDDWPELQRTPVWRLALDSSWLGRPQGTYIEGMAHRWDIAARTCLDAKNDFISIKYEEFIKDKRMAIENLAQQLELDVKKDISALVDVQHQSKGDSGVSPIGFFGEKNLEIIKNICGDSASQLGYEL